MFAPTRESTGASPPTVVTEHPAQAVLYQIIMYLSKPKIYIWGLFIQVHQDMPIGKDCAVLYFFPLPNPCGSI